MTSPGVLPASRKGAALRQAMREKNMQDLVYRSEYLATLISERAAIEAPPDQAPQQSLAASSVPRLVDTAASHLQTKHHDLFGGSQRVLPARAARQDLASTTASPAIPAPPVPAFMMDREVFSHTENLRHRLEKLNSTEGRFAPMQKAYDRSRPDIERNHLFHNAGSETARRTYRELTRAAINIADPTTAKDDLHGRSAFGDVLDEMKTMVAKPCSTAPQLEESYHPQNPLNAIRVHPGNGDPAEALGEDYLHVAEMELRNLASRCGHVQLLNKDWTLNVSATSLDFSRFFWNQIRFMSDTPANAAILGSAPGTTKANGRLCRMDGDDEFSARKFTLMEGGTVVLRQEGADPFANRALVIGQQPLPVLPQGHYMEVQVISVFKTTGRPDRPRQIEPRHRTEGLVLGFRATGLSREEPSLSLLSASDIPYSWSLSTSGTLHITTGVPSRPTRAISTERTKDPASWHRREMKSPCRIVAPHALGDASADATAAASSRADSSSLQVAGNVALRCTWPATTQPEVTKQQLGWSTAVGEKDRVGLLVTTFGGLVLFLNGRPEVMVPDAGVYANSEMHPIIEVYNHIRSVRLVPGAVPPA